MTESISYRSSHRAKNEPDNVEDGENPPREKEIHLEVGADFEQNGGSLSYLEGPHNPGTHEEENKAPWSPPGIGFGALLVLLIGVEHYLNLRFSL